MTPLIAITYLFVLWIVTWLAAAVWKKPASARPGLRREAPYYIVTMLGVTLLFGMDGRAPIAQPLWFVPEAAGWLLAAVAAAGLAFTWWARVHLGTLWSASVGRKADHHIVDTGPYGIVRHPIYTGIIAATAAVAVLRASPAAFSGFAILTLGWWIKARLEERFLREQLGAPDYDAYAARVPMLIPYTK